MKKQTVLILMAAIAVLWAWPFYESFRVGARSMADLSRFSWALVLIGMGVFVYLMHPLVVVFWVRLRDWLDGK